MNHDNWNPPHSHDPNPTPPGEDSALMLYAGSKAMRLTVNDLILLPQFTLHDCYIVSTGHGTSGPFTFEGVKLTDLVDRYTNFLWDYADVISGDGFRTRITFAALNSMEDRPAILALRINGRLLSRAEGLVRLIVPTENDDALQQVKWISEIRVR